ncbi:flavin-containing protein [Fusarium globosum]|uniref:Flavin-containing protein n=1 Tax=Fusarium globosum TaxID=78864 RepID=A0A8H6D356_9HYPO|nr:flavin-containing protein [Fusarium globosum]
MSADVETVDGGSLIDHLDRLDIEDGGCSDSQLTHINTEESTESNEGNDGTRKTLYFTVRHIYLARREFILETDEPDMDNAESVFFASGDHEILKFTKLPAMINDLDLIRKHAVEIIKTTEPMTTELSIRFGYLSNLVIYSSELRERCLEAVQAAFMAADSASEGPADPEMIPD